MPSNRTNLTFEQYLDAEILRATARAHAWWQQNMADIKPIERPAAETDWLDFPAVLKHTTFGETKFRELMKDNQMPRGKDVAGKLLWHKPAVDRAMAKLFKSADD